MLFRTLDQQGRAIKCREDCLVNLLEVRNGDNAAAAADGDNSVLKLWSIFSMVHWCRKSLPDTDNNSSPLAQESASPGSKCGKDVPGAPRSDPSAWLERTERFFGFLGELPVGVHRRGDAARVTVCISFRLSFPNQAPTLPQWLTLLLRTGYCCLAAASRGQRVGPGRQPRLTVKAEMELPRIPAVGGKWSQSSTFFPLDCSFSPKSPHFTRHPSSELQIRPVAL